MIVLKVGGNVINNPAALHEALDYFAGLVEPAVLVHGGGRRASELMRKLGLEPVLVDGRRVTDHATLEVVTMVYAGLLNKEIVAQLQSRGSNAIGLSGADGNTVRAVRRPVGAIDYGFVGDVEAVNGTFLDHLLRQGLRPVLCAITHDLRGQLLNTNADTIARMVGSALAERGHKVELQYCFEQAGVLRRVDDPDSVIATLSQDRYTELRKAGAIHSGMIPKLDNAFAAIGEGVTGVRIGHLRALREREGTWLEN
jgi:acetylglutamate kinase